MFRDKIVVKNNFCVCFYENRLFLCFCLNLSRETCCAGFDSARDRRRHRRMCAGLGCVCVRVGGAGEAKSKDNTYNQWMTCKVC